MYKKLKDLRKSKKGFTLVELIVVLVILAILAAILVPALLGYIDKAKEKQITTDANTVYTALQSVLDEQYGLATTTTAVLTTTDFDNGLTKEISDLTSITKEFAFSYGTSTGKTSTAAPKQSDYKIAKFEYYEDGKLAVLQDDGSWKTSSVATYTGASSAMGTTPAPVYVHHAKTSG